MKKRVIYYENELTDEFSEAQITPKVIDGKYNYNGGILRKILRVLIYAIIMHPIAFFYMKCICGHSFVNRKVIKKTKGAFYLYGNHTHPVADAFIPSFTCFPKGTYVIVHPNNVSMPLLGALTPCMGAVPLPGNMEASRNFSNLLKHHAGKGLSVTIYPEAHIWPYYTDIRPFEDKSFTYPVKFDVPAYCITNTYHKKLIGSKPKIRTYVDGPFYPDKSLSVADARKQLRDQIYNTMKERSKNNTAIYVEYIKKSEKI